MVSTPTFHQWTETKKVFGYSLSTQYGLRFYNQYDADVFTAGILWALEVLNEPPVGGQLDTI